MKTIKYGLLGALAAFIIAGMMFGIIGIVCELAQRYPSQAALGILAIIVLGIGFVAGVCNIPSSSDKGKDGGSKSS